MEILTWLMSVYFTFSCSRYMYNFNVLTESSLQAVFGG